MLRDVFTKTLYDERRALLAFAVSLVLLELMYLSFWPSIQGQPSIGDFLDQMPQAMRNLFAVAGADMSTPVGYVQIELFAFLGPMVFLLFTITAGAAAVAGEEERHTLDLLLTQPVSRRRVVADKLGAMVLGAVGLGAVAGVAFLAIGPLFDVRVPAGHLVAALVHLVLLGLVFGALALAVGAATGRPGLAKGVAAALAVVAYVVNGLAPMVSWLEPAQKFSPFYQYAAHDPLRNGLSGSGVLVALATVVALGVVAAVTFERRDVSG